jgi:arylsulfatase A-like enzyme
MAARKSAGSPSVLVFLTDQQRWDTTGAHGNPLGLTPNFDRMAASGTHLHSCFTCQPLCGPSRACLQTGLYPTSTGLWKNAGDLGEPCQLRPELPTLAQYFGSAGYTTGYIGKWHLYAGSELVVPAAQRRGYECWLAANHLEDPSEAYRTILYDGDDREVILPGYRTDAVVDAAIRFLGEHHRDRFFLFVSVLEPHNQDRLDAFIPPDGYREPYVGGWVPPDLAALGGSTHEHLASYYGCVKRVDEAFGRVLDALKSLGIQDDTIVLFTSDHGCHFETRNSEYKRSCHESSIRVPAALRGGVFDAGGQIRKLVSLVDIAPTLLDACGIPVPAHMQGRSIVALLRNPEQEWRQEVFVQISETEVGRAVRSGRWKYAVAAPGADGMRVPAADRYVESHLYDLELDPYELNDLVGLPTHRLVCEVMRERLLRCLAEAGEDVPQIEAAPARGSAGRGPHSTYSIRAEEARA